MSIKIQGNVAQGNVLDIRICIHVGIIYPLISNEIEEITGLSTISPCPFVAERVISLLAVYENQESVLLSFNFYKTSSNGELRFVSKDFSSLP